MFPWIDCLHCLGDSSGPAPLARLELALRLGLIFFAREHLGLSGVYAYLILRFPKPRTRLLRHYSLVLAFMTSFLGCLSASLLFFL